MIEIEEKSYRGMLVQIIIKTFSEECLVDELDNLKETLQDQLQDRLTSNLKFEANVSKVEFKNGQIFGEVNFEDENNTKKMTYFTIILSGKDFQN